MVSSTAEERTKYRNEAMELVRSAHVKLHEDAKKRQDARPKNIATGTLQGGGAAIGGIVVGAGAVVLVPVVGTGLGAAKGHSLSSNKAGQVVGAVGGAVGGLVAGAIGGVVVGAGAVVGGVGTGAFKVGEGTANMFRTTKNKNKESDDDGVEMRVNEMERVEYEAMRDEMYAQILGYSTPGEQHAGMQKVAAAAVVVDTELYDTLGVAPDADPVAIRKAYYQRAAATHPDKNPHDKSAHARFQKIGEAYQILSDAERRAAYDAKGRDADGSLLDPEKLYVLMFGSEKFRHLIGDSALRFTCLSGVDVSAARSATERQAALGKLKEVQKARVEELAMFLSARVEEFAQGGNKEALMRWASLEAAVLKEEQFGEDILHAVGYVYVKKAAQMLGYETSPLGIKGYFGALDEMGQMFKLKRRAVEGQFAKAVEEQVEAAVREKEGREPETVDEAEQRRAISSLGVAWLISLVDIETTLREVVEKVCTESGVERQVLVARAEAIVTLGQIYSEC